MADLLATNAVQSTRSGRDPLEPGFFILSVYLELILPVSFYSKCGPDSQFWKKLPGTHRTTIAFLASLQLF